MTRQLSASSVRSALACGYRFRPDVATVDRPSGEEAVFGTRVHAAVEAHCRGQEYDWGDYERAYEGQRHTDQAIAWLTSQPRVEYIERGIVYDAKNDIATWGPRRGEDGYDVLPSRWCIRGTLDIGWATGARLVDLKTGKFKDYSMQLRTLGLAVARILGLSTITVGALYTRKTKHVYCDVEVLGADALDEHAGRLYRLLRTLPEAQPVPGEQCNYCEAVTCPARAPRDDGGAWIDDVWAE